MTASETIVIATGAKAPPLHQRLAQIVPPPLPSSTHQDQTHIDKAFGTKGVK